MDKLIEIQNELKAPKDKTNKFGGYQYRNLDSILEAVKPLLKKHGCTLTFSDEVVEIGGHNYVKATARFNDGKELICTSAFARESVERKGMSSEQITGSASSYSRKYCAQALFLIDDSEMEPAPDPDTQPPEDEKPKAKPKATPKPKEEKPKAAVEATKDQRDSLWEACKLADVSPKWIASKVGAAQGHLTVEQFNEGMLIINEYLDKKEKGK